MNKIEQVKKLNIERVVSKFREDIVMANPVSFLVRAMNGEEFDGERLSVRDRVEVAKFLGSRILPMVAPQEVGVGTNSVAAPAPLTIVLNTSKAEVKNSGLDTLTVVGEHRTVHEENENV